MRCSLFSWKPERKSWFADFQKAAARIPVLPDLPVVEGVRFERERLSELRKHADQVIDTSSITVHELRDLLIRQFRQDTAARRMTISLVTFGYKFGVPYDIDLLFDVRFHQKSIFCAGVESH